MSFQDRFGEFASETHALQRALKWLQEHDRNTPSEETAEEVMGIRPKTLDELQDEKRRERDSILTAVNNAIDSLQARMAARTATPGTPTFEPGTLDDDLDDFEPLEPRRPGRKRTEIVNGKINMNNHKRRCAVCRHPDREAIEQAFIRWGRAGNIRLEFDLPNRRCLYRHARAVGLFEQRARNMRAALEYIIEEAETVKPTADSIIRAIRAYSCLDDQGRWTELPQRIVVARGEQPANAAALAATVPSAEAIPVEGREIEPQSTPQLPPPKS